MYLTALGNKDALNEISTSVYNEDGSIGSAEVSQSALGQNPTMTNNFTHESNLLQTGNSMMIVQGGGAAAFKQRANSHFRGTFNLNDMLSNQSLLQTNMSSSTMIDSSQPMKQKRSLNFINKKREAERIDLENAQLMKRLQQLSVSPHIDTKNI